MYCSNCGKKNSDTAKFCDECGAFLKRVPQTDDNTHVYQNEATPAEAELIQPVEDISVENEEETDTVTEYVAPEPVEPEPVTPEVQEDKQQGDLFPLDDEPLEEASCQVDAPVLVTKTAKSYVGLVFSYILIFILAVTFIGGIFLKVSVNGKQVSKDIGKIDLIDMQVGTILSSSDFDIDSKDTVEDIVYKSIQAYSDFNVSKDELDRIYDETNIKDFIADRTGEYADFVITGKKTDGITADDLYNLVDENKSKIEEITDIEIKDIHMQKLKEYFAKDDNQIVKLLSTQRIENKIESYGIDRITALTQNWVVYCALGALAIFIVLMSVLVFRVNKNNGASVIYLASVPIAIGSILLLCGIALYPFADKILSLFGNMKGIAEAYVPVMRGRLLLFGIIIFAVGLITVFVKKLVYRLKQKSAAKAALLMEDAD